MVRGSMISEEVDYCFRVIGNVSFFCIYWIDDDYKLCFGSDFGCIDLGVSFFF